MISHGTLTVEVEGDYIRLPATIGGTWSSIRPGRAARATVESDAREVERTADEVYWQEYLAAVAGAGQ